MNLVNSIKFNLSKSLHSILRDQQITILSGPLKGWKWLPDAGNHAYWLGTYEKHYTKLFAQSLQKGFVVFDIGAHTGYFSLIASRIVGNKGQVLAFEPFPRNINFIKKHLVINCCKNVKLLEKAVSSSSEIMKFSSHNSFMGRLSRKGEIDVEVIKLDDLMSQSDFQPPNIIKIDVEGHDYLVLKGAENLIKKTQPTLFIATHGEQNRKRVLELLSDWNYSSVMIQISQKNADYYAEPLANKT